MVVSFHPSVPGDRFFWARGRVTEEVAAVLRSAAAVILPPTVSRELYWLCRGLCPNVFPNYDARFRGEGKVGDTLLFWALSVPHPKTVVCPRVESLVGDHPEMGSTPGVPPFPFVIKGSAGGEGSQAWLVRSAEDLEEVLGLLKGLERRGQYGFVVQEFIEGLDRDLRVVVVGEHMEAYWRCGSGFHNNLARGGELDRCSDTHLMELGMDAVRGVCRRTGINLAAFDVAFRPGGQEPLLMEINYTFGLKGIGAGRFAELLNREVERWLSRCACPP